MRRRRQLPSYVRELVLEVGPDSVFWSSVREPGQRPDVGAGMDRMVNRVVGSSQSTDSSNPPTWGGSSVDFSGAEYFQTSEILDGDVPDGWTMLAVWEREQSINPRYLAGWEDQSDNIPAIQLLSNVTDVIRTKTRGANSNTANPSVDNVPLDAPSVTAHRVDWPQQSASVWADNGNKSASDTSSNSSLTKPNEFGTGYIGARGDAADPLVGSIYEVLITPIALEDAKMLRLIDRLKSEWKL